MSNSLQPRGLQPTRLLLSMEFSKQEYRSGLSFLFTTFMNNPKLVWPLILILKWTPLSRECVISLVLSHHNKNLKRWTSVTALWQTMSQLLDRSVLQLHVTAQFYLENKGKCILKVWGQANPKDVKKGEKERERGRVARKWQRGREAPGPLAPLFIPFFLPRACLCKLGKLRVQFVLPDVLILVLRPSFVLFSQTFPFLVFQPPPCWTPFSILST